MTIKDKASSTPAEYKIINVPSGVYNISDTVVITDKIAKQISKETPHTIIRSIWLSIFWSKSKISRFCLYYDYLNNN